MIRAGAYIDHLAVVYSNDAIGSHGGDGGGQTETVGFTPEDRLVAIFGSYGTYLNSISFYTSTGKVYGPYGGSGGLQFRVQAPDGYEIVNFFGRSGSYIDSLGVGLGQM